MTNLTGTTLRDARHGLAAVLEPALVTAGHLDRIYRYRTQPLDFPRTRTITVYGPQATRAYPRNCRSMPS